MIEVMVDLLPGGDRARRRNIQVIQIANVSNLAEVSDYVFNVFNNDGELSTSGSVKGHQRSSGIIPLLKKVLAKL